MIKKKRKTHQKQKQYIYKNKKGQYMIFRIPFWVLNLEFSRIHKNGKARWGFGPITNRPITVMSY
jgi:hypothetical protein